MYGSRFLIYCAGFFLLLSLFTAPSTDAASLSRPSSKSAVGVITPNSRTSRQAPENSFEDSDEDDDDDEAETDEEQFQQSVAQQQQQLRDDSVEESDEDDDGRGLLEATFLLRKRRDTELLSESQKQEQQEQAEKTPAEIIPNEDVSPVVVSSESQAVEDVKETEDTEVAEGGNIAPVAPTPPTRKSSVLILIRDALKKVTTGLPTEQVATNALQYFQLFEHFLQQTIEQVIGDDDDEEDETTTNKVDIDAAPLAVTEGEKEATLESVDDIAAPLEKFPESSSVASELQTQNQVVAPAPMEMPVAVPAPVTNEVVASTNAV